jgi:hypothetical protein
MKKLSASPLLPLAAAVIVFGGSVAPSFSETPSKTAPKDEEQVILEDAKKNYPVTPADMEACMKDWDPEAQMTKEEWKATCKRTLKYFPEEE